MEKAKKGQICVVIEGNLTPFIIPFIILNMIVWNMMQKQMDKDF